MEKKLAVGVRETSATRCAGWRRFAFCASLRFPEGSGIKNVGDFQGFLHTPRRSELQERRSISRTEASPR